MNRRRFLPTLAAGFAATSLAPTSLFGRDRGYQVTFPNVRSVGEQVWMIRDGEVVQDQIVRRTLLWVKGDKGDYPGQSYVLHGAAGSVEASQDTFSDTRESALHLLSLKQEARKRNRRKRANFRRVKAEFGPDAEVPFLRRPAPKGFLDYRIERSEFPEGTHDHAETFYPDYDLGEMGPEGKEITCLVFARQDGLKRFQSSKRVIQYDPDTHFLTSGQLVDQSTP